MREYAAQAGSTDLESETVEVSQQTAKLIALALAGTTLLYMLGIEQGGILQGLLNSHMVHEFVHDARHLSGFPCH